jgi:WS/DGAT/MGAT family acyltransferase
MAHYKYDRLSAQDNDFLSWETPNMPMHAGATQIFAAGDLATPEGGVDFATIKRGIEGILHKIPRYRQKLAWIPGTQRAVWVDDAQFNPAYHIRHTALPRPGTDEQLKQLAARIMERPMDRARPLWEIWVVEGLQGGRFATIGKTHHCVVDGMAGVDIAQNLYAMSPEYRIEEPRRYLPRPHPTDAELLQDERWRWATLPARTAFDLARFWQRTDNVPGEILGRVRGLGQLAWNKIVPASDTPLNGPVGPHRLVDWDRYALADFKALRHALKCSVNDVVLAIVTGAVREFLLQRQVHPEQLEFRVAAPVNVRGKEQAGRGGNRVSSWIVALPIGEADPAKQVAAIRHATQGMKESRQADAIELVEALHEWLPIDIQALSRGTQNMFVTNVPGPQFPLYLLGAELLDIYLQAPLIDNLGLVIGVISYNGGVCWGFNADYDRVPDLAEFVRMTRRAVERLADAAGVRLGGGVAVDVGTVPAPDAAAPLSPSPTRGGRRPGARTAGHNGNGRRPGAPGSQH